MVGVNQVAVGHQAAGIVISLHVTRRRLEARNQWYARVSN